MLSGELPLLVVLPRDSVKRRRSTHLMFLRRSQGLISDAVVLDRWHHLMRLGIRQVELHNKCIRMPGLVGRV